MPAKKANPAKRRRRNSRQAIIEAALQCFAAKNYDGASMSDIAEATGITKRAIYRYFPTKRELFYAVRNEVYASIVNHLWRELPPARDFVELADALMRAHLRFGLENPEMLRIVVNTISEAATREFQENIEALLADREEELERLVKAGIKEGTLDPSLDAGYLAWVFILIFYFLTYMLAFEEEWILSRGEEAASVILRPILDSLAPPERRRKPKKNPGRP
ncbi:MAG: TetR/AcrR family transcriptional regulator [Actinobacteria bacterium]|nr:TetR/AcrR family transcriptional regulator [Actinomycetota bacterium]